MNESPVGATDRWAQLTYTSFDDGVRAGGWQVKQTTGALSEDEQDRLRSQVVTNLDPVDRLPNFPTADDIAALPRRLVYVSDANGEGRYWHTVFAGPDATGRPGNVFVHALLDRRTTSDNPPLRPIQLWRSVDWLCPYGAESVRDAVLGSVARPRTGQSVSARSVIDFVLDPAEWRVGALAAVLDAVSAVLQGGPRIVLGVDSPDAAAAWIGAVSYLTSSDVARRISYTTFERASALEATWARGVLLAAVPSADLTEVELEPESGHAVVVIDSAEAVTLGVLGQGSHRTAAGSQIRVTPWSVLAEAAFVDETTAAAVLHELDVVATSVTTTAANPEWPLAAAMSALTDHFPDVAAVLRSTLLAGSPRDLSRFAALADRVAGEVRQEIGGSAAKAWDAVRANERASTYDMAVQSYLQLALHDETWLAQSPAAPVPPDTRVANTALGLDFDRAIADRLGKLDTGQVDLEAVAKAARVLDFGARAGLANPERPLSWTPDVHRLVAGYLAPALVGPAGPEVARAIPAPVSGPFRSAIVRAVDIELQERQEKAQLPELSDGVLGWLYGPDIPVFDVRQLVEEKLAYPGQGWPRPSSVAYILWLARTHGHEPSLPSFVRACALWFALDAEDLAPADANRDVARFARFALDAESAECLIRDFGPSVPSSAVVAALERAPWPQVRPLAEAVSRLKTSVGRWAVPNALVVQALARVRVRSNELVRRDGAWATALRGDLEVLFKSGLIHNEPTLRNLRGELVAATLVQYLAGVQARFRETGQPGLPNGLFGTAFTRPRAEPLYLQGHAVDALQSDLSQSDPFSNGSLPPQPSSGTWAPSGRLEQPRPSPTRAAEPAPPSLDHLRIEGPMGQIIVETVGKMAGSAIFDLVLPSMRAQAFDNDAIFAIALVGTRESGLGRSSKFAAVEDLLHLPTLDYQSVGEALMVELLRSKRAEIEPRRMDSLIDRIGKAEYGADTWSLKEDERSAMVKFSRKYFKDIQAKSESAPGEKSRGGLRRSH